VPLGPLLVTQIDPRMFKIGVGLFLLAYTAYALTLSGQVRRLRGGPVADAAAGFCGGVLGGMVGFSAPPVILWANMRGDAKEFRRVVLQTFNLAILTAALVAHASRAVDEAGVAGGGRRDPRQHRRRLGRRKNLSAARRSGVPAGRAGAPFPFRRHADLDKPVTMDFIAGRLRLAFSVRKGIAT